jgi:hypothetical protein
MPRCFHFLFASQNSAGNHAASIDPCTDINVQTWQDVPANRVTVDPHFDEGVAADYASIWNGRDNQFLFPNGFRKGQVFMVSTREILKSLKENYFVSKITVVS